MKTCSKCIAEKPLDKFSRNARSSDGRQAWCKACTLEYKRKWRDDNRDQVRATNRVQAKAYRENNPEKVRAWKHADYERASDAYKERTRQWNEANRERRRSHQRAYKERMAAVDHASVAEYTEILRRDPCCYCGDAMDVIDHIDPLKLSSDHSPDNLTAACAPCNSDKRAKPLLIWMLQVRGGEANATRHV